MPSSFIYSTSHVSSINMKTTIAETHTSPTGQLESTQISIAQFLPQAMHCQQNGRTNDYLPSAWAARASQSTEFVDYSFPSSATQYTEDVHPLRIDITLRNNDVEKASSSENQYRNSCSGTDTCRPSCLALTNFLQGRTQPEAHLRIRHQREVIFRLGTSMEPTPLLPPVLSQRPPTSP